MSVKIIQGEDRTLTVNLKTSTGDAYDVSGASAIVACFLDVFPDKSIGSGVTVVSGTAGKITVKLEDTDTSGMSTGLQGFTITVTEAGGDIRKINLANSLNVEEAIC